MHWLMKCGPEGKARARRNVYSPVLQTPQHYQTQSFRTASGAWHTSQRIAFYLLILGCFNELSV
jgi:hypothetical protein